MPQKVISLLSSGIDSPVASYLLLEKFDLVFIHFDNNPFSDKKSFVNVKRLVRHLKKGSKLYVVNHGKNQLEIMKNCNLRYQCVLCKRLMFRIAEKVAVKERASYLVTGENLGQVASQTLDNMVLLAKSIKKDVLRPLLCFDKNEIIELAKKIGTYDISIKSSVCCSAVPKNPVTRANLDKVELEESKINIEKLVEDSVNSAKIVFP